MPVSSVQDDTRRGQDRELLMQAGGQHGRGSVALTAHANQAHTEDHRAVSRRTPAADRDRKAVNPVLGAEPDRELPAEACRTLPTWIDGEPATHQSMRPCARG